jgi:hypothetical protein
MAATPIAFSTRLPSLQTKVNSSSLGPFKTCPRKYYYEVVLGLEMGPPSADLTFGSWVHWGLERYEGARGLGASHEEALEDVLAELQKETWDRRLGRPIDFGDPEKSRLLMLRTTVEYLDYWEKVPGYETIKLASGRPAVELTFEFDSGVDVEGERIVLVGKLDKIVKVEALGTTYVLDTKTTKMEVGKIYTSQYTPGNQFSMYAAAAQVCFTEPVRGVLLDAISVRGGEVAFTRLPIDREEEVLDEWLEDTRIHLRQMGEYARRDYWPQNDMSCGLFRGCQWREICGASPRQREFMLKGLRRRGD